MSRKNHWVGAGTGIMLLALGCAGGMAADAKVTLTFGAWGSATEYNDIWLPIVQDYESLHPDVAINLIFNPEGGLDQKIASMAAAGDAMDVWLTNTDTALADWTAGIAIDLAPLMQSDATFHSTDYFAAAMSAFQLNGHQFGLPDEFQVTNVWYNQDFFDKIGVAHPKDGWSRAEFEADAKKMTTVDANGQKLTWGTVLPLAGEFEMPWLFSAGGGVVDNLDQPTRCTLSDPPAIDAYEFLRRLVVEDQVVAGSSKDFYNGQVGMYPYYAIFQRNASYDHFRYSTATFPAGPAGSVNALLPGGFAMGDSKHPKEAWEFVKYLSRMDYLLHGIGQLNVIPAFLPMARSDHWPNVPLPEGYDLGVWVRTSLVAKPQMIKHPKAREMFVAMDAFSDAINGKVAVKNVATQACQTIDGLLNATT